jgi:hypothetical protein
MIQAKLEMVFAHRQPKVLLLEEYEQLKQKLFDLIEKRSWWLEFPPDLFRIIVGCSDLLIIIPCPGSRWKTIPSNCEYLVYYEENLSDCGNVTRYLGKQNGRDDFVYRSIHSTKRVKDMHSQIIDAPHGLRHLLSQMSTSLQVEFLNWQNHRLQIYLDFHSKNKHVRQRKSFFPRFLCQRYGLGLGFV